MFSLVLMMLLNQLLEPNYNYSYCSFSRFLSSFFFLSLSVVLSFFLSHSHFLLFPFSVFSFFRSLILSPFSHSHFLSFSYCLFPLFSFSYSLSHFSSVLLLSPLFSASQSLLFTLSFFHSPFFINTFFPFSWSLLACLLPPSHRPSIFIRPQSLPHLVNI